MGKLGASILNTCVPTGKRRLPVQELAFNKLRFFEALARLARLDHMLLMLQISPQTYPLTFGSQPCPTCKPLFFNFSVLL